MDIMEMKQMEYQISGSAADLSTTVEQDMEFMCNEVLLQKSISYAVDETESDIEDDEIKQSKRTDIITPEQFKQLLSNYTKLPTNNIKQKRSSNLSAIPSVLQSMKELNRTRNSHTNTTRNPNQSKHDHINTNSSTTTLKQVYNFQHIT